MTGQGRQGAFLRRGWRGGSTVQNPRATPAPHLVNRNFTASASNRLWVADATRIPCGEGVFWLAAVRDVVRRVGRDRRGPARAWSGALVQDRRGPAPIWSGAGLVRRVGPDRRGPARAWSAALVQLPVLVRTDQGLPSRALCLLPGRQARRVGRRRRPQTRAHQHQALLVAPCACAAAVTEQSVGSRRRPNPRPTRAAPAHALASDQDGRGFRRRPPTTGPGAGHRGVLAGLPQRSTPRRRLSARPRRPISTGSATTTSARLTLHDVATPRSLPAGSSSRAPNRPTRCAPPRRRQPGARSHCARLLRTTA
jgi:hypothetical protein